MPADMPPPQPPQVPLGIEAPVQFMPCPADMRVQRITLGGVDTAVVMMVTASTAMSTFWGIDAFRRKWKEINTIIGGIEVATADRIAKLHVAGGDDR